MLKDLLHGVRDLTRHPWFAAVAVLTLAVGIGANAAIFSIVNGVLLRPLPYPESGRLVLIWGNFLKLNLERLPAKAGEYEDYSKQTNVFEAVAAFERRNLTFTGKEQPERIRAAFVTPNLLSVLQVHPLRGREFTKDDSEPGRDNVVILSHGFWQRHFTNSDSGQNVTIDARDYSVVGVLPPGFEFPASRSQSTESVDVLIPLVFPTDQLAQRLGP